MKYIFLDIDGVLNNTPHFLFRKKHSLSKRSIEYMRYLIDPWNVRNLKYLTDEIEVSIIISSTWRIYYEIEEFNNCFSTFDICDLVVDKTQISLKSDFSTRSHEIDLWVCKRNIKKTDYIVIDDNDIYPTSHPHFDRFHRTNSDNGLTYSDACKILKKLEPSWRKPFVLF